MPTEAPAQPGRVIDLMEVLKRSLEETKGRKAKPAAQKAKRRKAG